MTWIGDHRVVQVKVCPVIHLTEFPYSFSLLSYIDFVVVLQGEDHTEYFIGLTPAGVIVLRGKVKVSNYFWYEPFA